MLVVMAVRPARLSYYFETASSFAADPFGLVERDGTWSGALCEQLGLSGSIVDEATLARLALGADRRIGVPRAPHRLRNAAYDCTFAAPKSVSVLFGLCEQEISATVATAHEKAVSAAMGYLEDNAAAVRHRRGGVDEVVPAKGFLEATFVHRTSRALDPHLHSHVVVANRSLDANGEWFALDARQLFAHLRPAGAFYRAALRHELCDRLGLSFGYDKGSFADVVGIDRRMLFAFSQRKAAIDAYLEGVFPEGVHSRALLDAVAATTRPSRDLSRPYGALVTNWRERALANGLSMGHLASLISIRNDKGRSKGSLDAAKRAVDTALQSLDGPFLAQGLFADACDRLDFEHSPSVLGDAVNEALSDPARVVGTARRTLSRSRVPRPGDRYFETTASRAKKEELDRLFSSGRSLDEPALPEQGDRSRPGVLTCDLSNPSHRAALENLVLATKARGELVRALVPDRFRQSALESLFDVVPLSTTRGARPFPLLIVDDRFSSAPIARAEAVTETLRGAGVVVMVRSSNKAPRRIDQGRAQHVDLNGALCLFRATDGRSALFASGIAALERAVVALGAHPRPETHLVCSDRDLGDIFGIATIQPSTARKIAIEGRPTRLVVLGGSSVLDTRRGVPSATSVVHVGILHHLDDKGARSAAARYMGVGRDELEAIDQRRLTNEAPDAFKVRAREQLGRARLFAGGASRHLGPPLERDLMR